jgi:hypothetical protein
VGIAIEAGFVVALVAAPWPDVDDVGEEVTSLGWMGRSTRIQAPLESWTVTTLYLTSGFSNPVAVDFGGGSVWPAASSSSDVILRIIVMTVPSSLRLLMNL